MGQSNDLSRERAREIFDKAQKASILVVGDLILDEFIWGAASRISPEAPVPVVEVEREQFRLGGAANVAANLRALGVVCDIVGISGDDRGRTELINLLETGALRKIHLLPDPDHRTSIKTRVIAGSQQLVRYDRESKEPDAKLLTQLKNRALELAGEADLIIVSDYGKGVVYETLVAELREKNKAAKILVDPKVEHAAYYRGADIMTPNTAEAEKMSGVKIGNDSDVEHAGRELYEACGAQVLVTRGDKGMAYIEDGCVKFSIPTVALHVFDVTGAGDTVISTLGAALAGGADIREAAVLANMAAGQVVAEVGTAVPELERLLESLPD